MPSRLRPEQRTENINRRKDVLVNGLQLSRDFYDEIGAPRLQEWFPDYLNQMAVGLCGRGSQCLGYDDDVSHDHGWGPQFIVFLNAEDFARIGHTLAQRLAELPRSYHGFE